METTMLIIVAFLVLLNVFFVIRGFALIDEVERMRNYLDDERRRSYFLFEKLLSDLRSIDLNGSFEADDEVGAVFEQIKGMIDFYRKLFD